MAFLIPGNAGKSLWAGIAVNWNNNVAYTTGPTLPALFDFPSQGVLNNGDIVDRIKPMTIDPRGNKTNSAARHL